MKRARSTWFVACLLGAASLTSLIASCSQDEGDTCQVDRDCASGLTCCAGNSGARGVCGHASDPTCGGVATDAGAIDSGANMSVDDSGTDKSDDAGDSDGG